MTMLRDSRHAENLLHMIVAVRGIQLGSEILKFEYTRCACIQTQRFWEGRLQAGRR